MKCHVHWENPTVSVSCKMPSTSDGSCAESWNLGLLEVSSHWGVPPSPPCRHCGPPPCSGAICHFLFWLCSRAFQTPLDVIQGFAKRSWSSDWLKLPLFAASMLKKKIFVTRPCFWVASSSFSWPSMDLQQVWVVAPHLHTYLSSKVDERPPTPKKTWINSCTNKENNGERLWFVTSGQEAVIHF